MHIKKIKVLASIVFVLTFLLGFHSVWTVSAEVKQESQLTYISTDQVSTGGIISKPIRGIQIEEVEEESDYNIISSTRLNSSSIAKYSDNYGYRTLSDNGRRAYKALESIGLSFHNGGKDAKKMYYRDEKGVQNSVYVTKVADISSYNVYASELNKIFFAFEADHPMLYWASGVVFASTGSVKNPKVTSIYLTVDKSYYSASIRAKIQRAINSGVKSYCKKIDAMKTKGVSDLSIELMVHDMLINKCSYAFDSYGEPENAAWAHNIYGIFGKNTAVCQGYAKAFQLLMNYAGIECIYAIGWGLGEGHAWNLVKLDGTWYGVDTTWNDTGDGIAYYFFNTSTKLFSNTHKYDYYDTNLKAMYKVPAVSSIDTYWYYTYYKLKHTAAPNLTNVTATFKAALSKVESNSQYKLHFAMNENYAKSFGNICVNYRETIGKSLSSNGKLYQIGSYTPTLVNNNPVRPWNFAHVNVSLKTISNIKDNVTYFDRYQFQVYNTDSTGKSDITSQVTTATQDGKLVISYHGAVIGSYTANVKSVQVSPIADVIYRGEVHTPKPVIKIDGITLIEGTDYTLSYTNNVNAGTGSVIISGKGKYLGKKTVKFTIKPLSLAGGKIKAVAAKTYSGRGIIPSLHITSASGVKINAVDYTITVKNNVNVGTATVIVTGKSNTFGTLTTRFQIKKRNISTCTVKKISNQNYSGKTKKPSLTIKCGTKTLVNNVDYKVKYTSNIKPGQAKIVITGIGANLTGTKTVYFNIVPKKVSGFKASSYSRKIVIRWSKSSYASGYNVYYSTSKSRAYKSWGSTTANSITKTGLKRGKVYYLKVRPYKTIHGKRQYGMESKIIRIVVK